MRLAIYLTVLLLAAGCTITVEDVRQYGQEKNADLLVRTIEKNYHNNDQEDLVKAAVEELIMVEGLEAWPYLGYRFDRGFSEDLKRHALQTSDPTLNMTTLQIRLLDHFSREESIAARKLLKQAADLNISTDLFPENVTDQMEVAMEVSGQHYHATLMQEDLKDALKDHVKRRDLNQERANRYLMFIGSIVVNQGDNLYEIVGPWGGQHALLLTVSTSFTGPGSFRLPVEKLTEMPVTLRQELGGFTQQWKVYRETNIENIDLAREAGSKSYALQDSISETKKDLRHYEAQITKLEISRKAEWSRLDSVCRVTFAQFYASQ